MEDYKQVINTERNNPYIDDLDDSKLMKSISSLDPSIQVSMSSSEDYKNNYLNSIEEMDLPAPQIKQNKTLAPQNYQINKLIESPTDSASVKGPVKKFSEGIVNNNNNNQQNSNNYNNNNPGIQVIIPNSNLNKQSLQQIQSQSNLQNSKAKQIPQSNPDGIYQLKQELSDDSDIIYPIQYVDDKQNNNHALKNADFGFQTQQNQQQNQQNQQQSNNYLQKTNKFSTIHHDQLSESSELNIPAYSSNSSEKIPISEQQMGPTLKRTSGQNNKKQRQVHSQEAEHNQMEQNAKKSGEIIKSQKGHMNLCDNPRLNKVLLMLTGKQDGDNESSIENAKITKVINDKILIIDLNLCIFASICFAISYLENNIEFELSDPFQQDFYCFLSLMLTIMLQILVVFRAKVSLELMKWQKLVVQNESILRWRYLKPLFIELLILTPHPNPYFYDINFYFDSIDKQLTLFYRLNEIMNIILLLRCYLIGRYFLKKCEYYTNRAHRLTRLYSIDLNYLFVIKCLFKKYPFQLIIPVTIGGIVFFTHCLQIAEGPQIRGSLPDSAGSLYFLRNSMWLVWITMTTVGYGDYTAKTQLGRLISIIIAIYGLLLISIIVVVLQSQLSFNPLESQSLALLQILKIKESMKQMAVKIIAPLIKFIYLTKRSVIEQKQNSNKNKNINIKNVNDNVTIINENMNMSNSVTVNNNVQQKVKHSIKLQQMLSTIKDNLMKFKLIKQNYRETVEEQEHVEDLVWKSFLNMQNQMDQIREQSEKDYLYLKDQLNMLASVNALKFKRQKQSHVFSSGFKVQNNVANNVNK